MNDPIAIERATIVDRDVVEAMERLVSAVVPVCTRPEG